MSLTPLNADLDVIQNLVIPFLEDDLDIIQKLDDEPNDVGGLTSSELKTKFDEAGNIIKSYINNTLVLQLSDTVAEAEERARAEAERIANEASRVIAETARAEAEQARAAAEAARVLAEDDRASAETSRREAEAARVLEEQARVDRDTGIVAQATEQADLAANSAASAAESAAAAKKEVENAKDEVANAQGKVEDAEAWARGTRNGADVPATDPAYQNNSKYWAESAKEIVGPTVTPTELAETVAPINQAISGLATRVQPINLGGTNATTADDGRKNLGAAAVKALTQAEYDALSVVDPDTVYIITDANSDGVKIETGSYVGTGTYGADNPNTLTFEFEPKIVMVNNNGQYGVIAIRDSGGALCAANTVQQTVSWSEKTVSWYCSGTQTNANNQMNQSNGIYKYVAIG